MIEKELTTLKETERQCRELLQKAEEERQEILRLAKENAKRRHADLVREAHAQGEALLEQAKSEIAVHGTEEFSRWQDRVAQVKQNSAGRIPAAAQKIFEGMWADGNRANV